MPSHSTTLCAITTCHRVHHGRGLCTLHYQRWRRTGSIFFAPRKVIRVIDRFWRSVEKTSGCWLWKMNLDNDGYGRLGIGSRSDNTNRLVLAHRWAYEYFVGPILSGLTIDHLCRRRNCVNPAHMEAVTLRVNILRGIAPTAVNARKTRCIRGHPFDARNTRMKGGVRQCRICVNASRRRSSARKAMALQ